jgi:hypothetical protein
LKSERKRGGAPPERAPQIEELGNVYREARMGSTPLADATRLALILKTMRDCLETLVLQQLDERLRQLEDPLGSLSTEQRPGSALQ